MRLLSVTLITALFLRTIGSVSFHPLSGNVKLPSPSGYVTTWLLWFILGLIAALGPRASRLAGQLSALIVLTMLVSKNIGGRLIGFMNWTTKTFPAQGAAA